MTQRQTATHTHIHILKWILKWSVDLIWMFLDCGRKPEETHTGPQRKPHQPTDSCAALINQKSSAEWKRLGCVVAASFLHITDHLPTTALCFLSNTMKRLFLIYSSYTFISFHGRIYTSCEVNRLINHDRQRWLTAFYSTYTSTLWKHMQETHIDWIILRSNMLFNALKKKFNLPCDHSI